MCYSKDYIDRVVSRLVSPTDAEACREIARLLANGVSPDDLSRYWVIVEYQSTGRMRLMSRERAEAEFGGAW